MPPTRGQRGLPRGTAKARNNWNLMMLHGGQWLYVMLLAPLGCSDSSPTPAPTAKESGAGPVPTTTQATDERTSEGKLYGTWLARHVDTKRGEVKIELTFWEEGPMKLAAWSDIPFVGKVRDKTAPYDVQGNVISSDAIRGGTSVEYSFDGTT